MQLVVNPCHCASAAEAIGALCRLFCSKRTDEDISPIHQARFYLALQHGLSVKEVLAVSANNRLLTWRIHLQPVRYAVVASILMNSTKLFQLDLNGVNILIPHFLKAMELVISNQARTR